MKTIEFTPDAKPVTIPPSDREADACLRLQALAASIPNICHTLKNKLTPILGYAQIVHANCKDAHARERLERIERSAGELTEALNLLRESFRAEPPARRPESLNRVVEGLAGRWSELARAARARVVLDLEPGLPDLPLDAGGMRLLLLELAANAGLALADPEAAEREIRISTRGVDGALELAVRDSGRGMGEEEIASIWKPFVSGFPGRAGLGLAICERIIADHGAARRVESRPGEFSRFGVTFPLPAGGRESGHPKP